MTAHRATTVGAAVYEWLTNIGADGLAGDECGCPKGDMWLCDRADANCRAARYIKCDDCARRGTEECIYPGDECDGCFFALCAVPTTEEENDE